jgi:hypothetical protein
MPAGLPRQFVLRVALVVLGAGLLLIGGVQGAAAYLAWGLIGVALASELTANLVWYRRDRLRRGR